MFSKKIIIKKTFQISICTALSRVLGILRETLTIRYLGAGIFNDAFVTAFKIPNGLRKIFAEGALSAALIPTITASIHERGKSAANGIMSLSFLLFEGLVVLLCILSMVYAKPIIGFIAPGFSLQAVDISCVCLRILMPFIFFISSSALLAGSLQTIGQFLVPAIAPVVLNLIFIGSLLICLFFRLPIHILCWGIMCGGIAQCLLHLFCYLRNGFGFAGITKDDIRIFKAVLIRFFLCLPSVSLMELSLFIDTSFASYLKSGSITLLYLANRFVGIPLGIFAVAFATVLLPHFSRVAHYAPKRLSFYLFEGGKLVFWVCVPVMILMWFFAENIFETLFLSGEKFTAQQVIEAADILRAFLIGLFFYSFNKVVLNVYYALQIAWVPALISAVAAVVNLILDWFLLDYLQGVGLALATTLSAAVRMLLLLVILQRAYKQRIYVAASCLFMIKTVVHATLFFIPFYTIYYTLRTMLLLYLKGTVAWFFLHSIGFWFWVGPLCVGYCGALWYTHKKITGRIYFLN